MSKIAVLGGGGWAIALAKVAFENGNKVTIWSKVEREIEALSKTRENKISLPGVILSDEIELTLDLETAISDADIIVIAVASKFVRDTAKSLRGLIPDGQIVVNVAKGIEDDTFYTMTEIIEDELENADVTVLSGPSHAEEVARRVITAVVIGARSKETARTIQKAFSNSYFRCYGSPDIRSIELGGSLKNVIALAAGILDGLGLCGDNTEAALIIRGIKEIMQLSEKMGGHKRTINGLSGMGDLIVTCQSKHSRNRRAGVLIGKGYTLDEAVKEVNMVVEGISAAKVALELGKKYDVNMPIITAVNEVLFQGKTANEAMSLLMNRRLTDEFAGMSWDEEIKN